MSPGEGGSGLTMSGHRWHRREAAEVGWHHPRSLPRLLEAVDTGEAARWA